MSAKQPKKPVEDLQENRAAMDELDPGELLAEQIEPAHAVVPVHAGRLIPNPETPLSRCPTNIDLTKFAGKVMLMAAGNPPDIEFGKEESITVKATHYLIFPDQGADPETGEMSTFARTVLFTREGKTFRTTSAHAPSRIAAALDLFSVEDWERGIPFVIRQRRSAKTGRTYHDIRIAPEMP